MAGLSYFANRSHSWYTAFLKTFVLVQGTFTLQVKRHARRTRRGEGNALGNLGSAYYSLGEVEKASALLQQAKAIGEQISDPQMVQVATSALKQLVKLE